MHGATIKTDTVINPYDTVTVTKEEYSNGCAGTGALREHWRQSIPHMLSALSY
jgi:hypothetical protein